MTVLCKSILYVFKNYVLLCCIMLSSMSKTIDNNAAYFNLYIRENYYPINLCILKKLCLKVQRKL